MTDINQYKPTHPMKGAWLLLTSKRRYLDAAVEHVVWLNLKAEDLRRAFFEGKYVPDSHETRTLELQRLESLRDQLLRSFLEVAVVAILALAVGIGTGAIDTDLTVHPGKALAYLGTYLAAWAALFELGGPGLASWGGETLSEVVHPKIFQILFVPGTLMLLCSILL
ncbi:hypothetical protein [Methylobacter sp.]|jgi:hypothetical protein|uniref:hypothetical protein n=1 Tax=Methylobacter sp. TaxID=2051955 RepID=UPI003DA52646